MTKYNPEANYWQGKSYKKWRKNKRISTLRDEIKLRDFKSEMKTFMQYHLWMEGYSATGNYSPATYLGTFVAESFIEACKKWHSTLQASSRTNCPLNIDENGVVTYWACRIFDNELDARKIYG